jgi:hypothetical protein
MYEVEDQGRQLARMYPEPSEAQEMPAQEGTSLTTIWGLMTTQNFAGGPMRGDVQGVLEYLRSLGEDTVVPPSQDEGAA